MKEIRPPAWPGDHPLFRDVAPRVIEAGGGRALLHVYAHEKFANRVPGGLHGGSYGCFGACAAEIAAATTIDASQRTSFVEYRVQIFRPVLAGDTARVEATVRHRGKRFAAVSVTIANGEGKPCAYMTASLAIHAAEELPPPPGQEAPALPPWTPQAESEYALAPSWRHFGIRVLESGEGRGKIAAGAPAIFHGLDGRPHPAYIAFVADSATPPTFVSIDGETTCTTLEYKVNFLRPAHPGPLTAEATVLQRDTRTLTDWVVVRDSLGSECAAMLTTLAVIPRPAPA
jgi:acyl-coenzyme A thioesterase PaaI-like protein